MAENTENAYLELGTATSDLKLVPSPQPEAELEKSSEPMNDDKSEPKVPDQKSDATTIPSVEVIKSEAVLRFEEMFKDRYTKECPTYAKIMEGFEPSVVVYPWNTLPKRVFDHSNHRGGRGGRFHRDRGGHFNNRGRWEDRGRGGRYDNGGKRPYPQNRDDRQGYHNRDDRQNYQNRDERPNYQNRDDRSNYHNRRFNDENRRGGFEGGNNRGGNQFHGNRNTYYPGRS